MKNKAISVISNWKTIVSTALMILGVIVWVADTRYITKTELKNHTVRQLYNDIETMEVVKGYNGSNQSELYEMLVVLKKNRIKQLKVK